jgi:3-deoxy-D-arabino-heptulosonate 7-phosphate (DAHP) synthase class II
MGERTKGEIIPVTQHDQEQNGQTTTETTEGENRQGDADGMRDQQYRKKYRRHCQPRDNTQLQQLDFDTMEANQPKENQSGMPMDGQGL